MDNPNNLDQIIQEAMESIGEKKYTLMDSQL